MATVLAFGTFDVFHAGHEFFLRQAAELGALHVVVAPDAHVLKLKGRAPNRGEGERKATIERLPYVAHVHSGDAELGSYGVVKSIRPDIIALGHDQTALAADLERWMKETGTDVRLVILPKQK